VLAQSNHLSPEDISDGTITVSNIGTIAGTYAIPLIYGKEVAIVALGRAEHFPRYESKHSDVIKKVPIMPLSWSADHRVVDGATLASFCKTWKSYLESPEKMILHLA
jgi:2-oxoisovalerate dehydrogenase E2 component (dihydrolipoyl transacylase)